MKRGRQFGGDFASNLTFQVNGLDRGMPTITAHHPDFGQVGIMGMRQEETGHRVNNIHVNEEHRLKGVGTAMWNHASALGLNPLHSSNRTVAGNAWAKKVGGELPPLEDLWL